MKTIMSEMKNTIDETIVDYILQKKKKLVTLKTEENNLSKMKHTEKYF